MTPPVLSYISIPTSLPCPRPTPSEFLTLLPWCGVPCKSLRETSFTVKKDVTIKTWLETSFTFPYTIQQLMIKFTEFGTLLNLLKDKMENKN